MTNNCQAVGNGWVKVIIAETIDKGLKKSDFHYKINNYQWIEQFDFYYYNHFLLEYSVHIRLDLRNARQTITTVDVEHYPSTDSRSLY